MEDVKSEKIEYLFLDIEWNQAPGTSDLDGREAIQIRIQQEVCRPFLRISMMQITRH